MFEDLYEKWLKKQLAVSIGDRKRRLEEQRHAERLFLKQVWWPAVGISSICTGSMKLATLEMANVFTLPLHTSGDSTVVRYSKENKKIPRH